MYNPQYSVNYLYKNKKGLTYIDPNVLLLRFVGTIKIMLHFPVVVRRSFHLGKHIVVRL